MDGPKPYRQSRSNNTWLKIVFVCFLLVVFTFFVIVEATCAFVYIVINNNKESKQNQQKINKNNLESCDVFSTLSIWLWDGHIRRFAS